MRASRLRTVNVPNPTRVTLSPPFKALVMFSIAAVSYTHLTLPTSDLV